MASKTIGINITGKNNASSALKGAAKDINTLGKTTSYTMEGINKDGTKVKHVFEGISQESKKAGNEIGNNFNKGANTAKLSLGRLGGEGTRVGGTISNTFSHAGGSIGSNISKGSGVGIRGLDNIGKASSTAGSAIKNNIAKGAAVASKSLDKLKSAAGTTFSNIKSGASTAMQSMDGLEGAIMGLAGGYGALQMAQSAWLGSTQAEFNQAYLATKVGNKAAKDYIKTIQGIVAVVPGDDTFMNQILTGSLAKQSNLTTAELKSLAYGVADYVTVSQSMGKSQIETQMDLKEYITTGNTSQLERDSILKNQMSTLEGQGTVSERILALNKALKAEGYAGLSQLDIASIKAEELKGKFQLVLTELGTKILPTISGILDYLLKLDSSTGGWSTKIMVIGAGVALIGMALAPVLWSFKQVFGTAKGIGGALKTAAGKLKDFILPSKKKIKIECDRDKDCNTGGTTAGGKSSKSSKNSSGSTIFRGLSGVGKAGVLLNGIAIPGIVTIAAGNAFADSGARTTSLNSKGQVQTSKTKTASDYTWTPGGKKVTGSKEPIISDKKVMDFLNSINPFKGTSANKKTNANTGSMDITKGWKLPSAGELLGSITGILQKGGIIPKINWPNVASISAWIISKIPKLGWKWPTIESISAWLRGKIPKLNWKWPNLGSISAWIRSKVPRLSWKWPSIGKISSYVQSKIGRLRFPNISWSSVASWIQSKIPKLNWPSGPGGFLSNTYSTAVGYYNKVKAALTPKGPRGPSDGVNYNGLSLNYENYPGSKKNAITGNDCLSGNCVDMSLGLMQMNGGRGSLVMGTWNGGSHMWYKDPSGKQLDPARKALQNTWRPPARGPSSGSGNQIIITGDVYGFNDFARKVEQANDKIIGNNLTL